MRTKNPCHGCNNASIHGNRHSMGWKDDCFTCEKHKEYRKYLDSKKQYEPGELITSLDELMKEELVMWNGVIRHMGFIASMQLRCVNNSLKNGTFIKAVKIEREDK